MFDEHVRYYNEMLRIQGQYIPGDIITEFTDNKGQVHNGCYKLLQC